MNTIIAMILEAMGLMTSSRATHENGVTAIDIAIEGDTIGTITRLGEYTEVDLVGQNNAGIACKSTDYNARALAWLAAKWLGHDTEADTNIGEHISKAAHIFTLGREIAAIPA